MIRSLLLAGTMSVAFTVPTLADEFYNHNSSLVEIEWQDGDGMIVKYVRPRSGLPSSVRRGTVLFRGAAPANGSIYGTAFIFSDKCGSIGYRVDGQFYGDNFWIDGAAPVRNSNCQVIRYEMNQNSRLDFFAR